MAGSKLFGDGGLGQGGSHVSIAPSIHNFWVEETDWSGYNYNEPTAEDVEALFFCCCDVSNFTMQYLSISQLCFFRPNMVLLAGMRPLCGSQCFVLRFKFYLSRALSMSRVKLHVLAKDWQLEGLDDPWSYLQALCLGKNLFLRVSMCPCVN